MSKSTRVIENGGLNPLLMVDVKVYQSQREWVGYLSVWFKQAGVATGPSGAVYSIYIYMSGTVPLSVSGLSRLV